MAGFIARRGDVDWYSFDAKKGDQFMRRGARRANRHARPTSTSRFATAKTRRRDLSGELDDDNDSLHPFGFFTRTTDPPPYKFTAPEDGKYPRHRRLPRVERACTARGRRIGCECQPAKPDFRAVAMPYSRHYQTGSSAWQGGNEAYDVYVHRIDGYAGTVTVDGRRSARRRDREAAHDRPRREVGHARARMPHRPRPRSSARFTLKATGTTPDGKPLGARRPPGVGHLGHEHRSRTSPGRSRGSISRSSSRSEPEKAFFTMSPDLANAMTKVNGKDEKLARAAHREAGRQVHRAGEGELDLRRTSSRSSITAEPMAQTRRTTR